jgi:hypothetical protein
VKVRAQPYPAHDTCQEYETLSVQVRKKRLNFASIGDLFAKVTIEVMLEVKFEAVLSA